MGKLFTRFLQAVPAVLLTALALKWPPVETLPFYPKLAASLPLLSWENLSLLRQLPQYLPATYVIRVLLLLPFLVFLFHLFRDLIRVWQAKKSGTLLPLAVVYAAVRTADLFLLDNAIALRLSALAVSLLSRKPSLSSAVANHPLTLCNLLFAVSLLLIFCAVFRMEPSYLPTLIRQKFSWVAIPFRKFNIRRSDEHIILHVISDNAEEYTFDLKSNGLVKDFSPHFTVELADCVVWLKRGDQTKRLESQLYRFDGYSLSLQKIKI